MQINGAKAIYCPLFRQLVIKPTIENKPEIKIENIITHSIPEYPNQGNKTENNLTSPIPKKGFL